MLFFPQESMFVILKSARCLLIIEENIPPSFRLSPEHFSVSADTTST